MQVSSSMISIQHSVRFDDVPVADVLVCGTTVVEERQRHLPAGRDVNWMLNAGCWLLNQLQEFLDQLTRDSPDIVPLEVIMVYGYKRSIR